MRKNPHKAGAGPSLADEIVELERALDRAYTRLREQALANWARYQRSDYDSANAIVRVRVTATDTPRPSASLERKPRLLVRKCGKARSKIPTATRRRQHN